jgi:cell division protein FtsI/penicillin-binding protein 2
VIGKTGTAQITAGKQDTSLFVAVTPPDVAPNTGAHQYVVVVVVEQAGFGGSVAAPIARRIVDALNGNPNPASVRIFPPAHD